MVGDAALTLQKIDMRMQHGVCERCVALQIDGLKRRFGCGLVEHMGEPRLANAGFADKVDELRRTGAGLVEQAVENVPLLVPVDQRCAGTPTRLSPASLFISLLLSFQLQGRVIGVMNVRIATGS